MLAVLLPSDDARTRWSFQGCGISFHHGLHGAVGMVFYAHVVYVTCYFCYMFSLGPSSGSSGSVRIYRRVIFGKQNWRCARTLCSLLGSFRHEVRTSVTSVRRRCHGVGRGQPLTDPSPGTIPHICSPKMTLLYTRTLPLRPDEGPERSRPPPTSDV